MALREDLGFVCESGLDARAGWEAGGGRWMHELGVAFARLDPQGRGFLWSANRLQPSMAARNYSQHLLDRFRAFCDALEVTRDEPPPATSPAPAATPPPPPAAPRDAAGEEDDLSGNYILH